MSRINDGGTAFPYIEPKDGGYCEPERYQGMSLRDYFAAKALQGMAGNPTTEGTMDDLALTLAAYAYQMADAMLLAREK